MSAPPGRGRARLPAGPPDHGPHRRPRRLVRPARRREAELVELLAWADGRGPGRRRGRLGLEPAGRRRGLPRARDQARRRAGDDRARRRAAALRRRRPAALGGGEGRRLGALRARVRGQHPRHRRRRGADERQRLRRPARRGARVGRRLHRRRHRAPRPRRSSASPTATRTSARARSSPAPPSGSRPATRTTIRATLAAMRERRREAQPSGIKTFGSTFKNPEDQRAEGRTAGQLLEAAGCRGLRHGGARFSEKHANFVENDRRGDHRRRAGADGRGPAPGPRALRRRARARGPGARRGAAGPSGWEL